MSVASQITQDLAEVGKNRYSETKQRPGRNEFTNQMVGGIGSEGISKPSYLANSARIIRRGKQRRPSGYWQSRMTTSGLNYSTELMAEATLNVAEPSADVASIMLDEEEDDADLFRRKVEERYENKLDEMKDGMQATTGNAIFQVEKKIDRLKDRLKTELP